MSGKKVTKRRISDWEKHLIRNVYYAYTISAIQEIFDISNASISRIKNGLQK